MIRINTACGCNRGKIRANNEDNYYFNGEYLPVVNNGLTSTLLFQGEVKDGMCFAVFDGMGGELYGELAAFTAAQHLQELLKTPQSGKETSDWLGIITASLNKAVLERAQAELTRHMGATMAGIAFAEDKIYAFNLGDSRVYLNRGKILTQLSVDHVDRRATFSRHIKPSLTQHLGIDEEEFMVEPSVISCDLKAGDRFLLCSDGLTDMLADQEIGLFLQSSMTAQAAVESLIAASLEKGGRDNVTVIVCEIQ